MIDILIVDDHPLVQDGIQSMLKNESSLRIIGACKTAKETLSFLLNTEPDVILLDINLPDMNGLELCEKIRGIYSRAKIIGLTSVNEAGIIKGLLQRGGNGYLLKNMERAELLEAIEKVMGGRIHISEDANEKVLETYKKLAEPTQVPLLTRREKEILHLLAEGLKGPAIAERLFLSPFTVETHRKNLLRKFKANSVQLLLKVARDAGLL